MSATAVIRLRDELVRSFAASTTALLLDPKASLSPKDLEALEAVRAACFALVVAAHTGSADWAFIDLKREINELWESGSHALSVLQRLSE
jgi:hypothetical protein